MKYADIAIDTRSDMVDDPFTYACDEGTARAGSRVSVPFAGSRARGAYIVSISDSPPAGLENRPLKKIISIDPEHSLTTDAVSIALWMRRRYFCRLIDALACFAPPADPPKRAKTSCNDFDGANNNKGKNPPPPLTPEQSEAFGIIRRSAEAGEYKAFLVHGVTGSGKTELYMRVADSVISSGRKVIVLVPEISLTPQLTERFVSRFGAEKIALMHSKMSKGERYAEWSRARNGKADIVIGARGAVFAPFENIGAIIVDEEHETTYKSDMSPKYDTVEVALKRAVRAGAVCVLGSATPGVVSMHRAKSGLYELIKLTERYNKTPLPRVSVVDMREELKRGNRSVFSAALHASIETGLAAGKQTILFLNRRGYSTFVSCRACGHVLNCPDCGISMTYHKGRGRVECHFCGSARDLPASCPECGEDAIRYFGAGTEKIEELTKAAFPGVAVARLDLDSASPKGAINKILKGFEKGSTDILIGTQMVAKGLDYDNVSPVGVIAADVSLNVPDFRAAERAFQLITQVAGRAGRGEETGEVYIQTYSPGHYAIEAAAAHDYEGFYETELLVRRTLAYPPYSDIVRVNVFAPSETAAERAAQKVKEMTAAAAGKAEESNILGPQKAIVFKQGKDYCYTLNIKVMPAARADYERILSGIKRKINTDKAAGYRIMIDVNPFSIA